MYGKLISSIKSFIMEKRTIILVVSLFILIVIGMFTYTYIKKNEMSQVPIVETPVVVEDSLGIRIDAKHFFIDGVHTFVGEMTMPTPCDLLEVNSVVQESYPEQIRLDFTIINNSTSCEQVPTNQRFMVSAKASSEAKVSATYLGKSAELNLIPAGPNETPDEFEIYIKG